MKRKMNKTKTLNINKPKQNSTAKMCQNEYCQQPYISDRDNCIALIFSSATKLLSSSTKKRKKFQDICNLNLSVFAMKEEEKKANRGSIRSSYSIYSRYHQHPIQRIGRFPTKKYSSFRSPATLSTKKSIFHGERREFGSDSTEKAERAGGGVGDIKGGRWVGLALGF